MEVELEAKFLDIDKEVLRKKLKEVGAKLIYPERLMKRNVFDYPDERLEKEGAWVRVRDEGDNKITLSYKRLVDRTLQGTKEITLDVADFDTMTNFLLAIGLKQDAYQETKREKWELDGSEITIDTWPWIPTFVEIESSTENGLTDIAKDLGFDWSQAMHGSVETAYQKYYDVTEQEIDGWESITFVPVPDWLEVKRKKL
ncbi:MAG: class IV adenylate cyclase [Candidatus Yanofskybacteria bacterium]|nr:class IV adenylate cyclase [Candidatus Yanofskybacteria bacterium]